MALEKSVQNDVWLDLAKRKRARITLFRTNSGKGIVGGKPVYLPNGTVMVPFGRPIALGLATVEGDSVDGQGDLTGFAHVEITPDMVGRTLPVFAMIETKASKGGRKRQNQQDCIARVQAAGGIAGFASSVAEANEIVDAWLRQDVPGPV